MVRSKREIITPRKKIATAKQRILDRTITKVLSRPNSGACSKEKASSANIKVIVRVRPPNVKEEAENFRQVVEIVEDEMLIFDPEEKTPGFFFHGVQQKGRDLLKKAKKNIKFYFDKIYAPGSTNSEVFEGSTQSLINNIMDGYNCSVFAYGATGAGKTYTMTGTAESPGITFLTMTELFKKQEELAHERDFELGIAYLEVYNELVKDLLQAGPPLNLREDSNYGVIVAGIKVFKVSNAHELFKLLQQGNTNRTQHPTDANAESSRSHAVFQVYLKMTIKMTKEVRTAKLSMIDLAGSERGSATGYVGARFTEGANINKSLLALGNCINSLADGRRHVPYRDSKLTRLLKDSLGGNCQTVMIANVSPSSRTYDDTYNTLKYATRANSIKASLHRNVSKADLNVMQYVKLVEDLTNENNIVKAELAAEKLKNETLEQECIRLKSDLEKSVGVVQLEPSLIEEIGSLIQQKRDLLERRFQLERNESSSTLRRLLKEDIDNRLSDICSSTPEKQEARDKINSTITRCKKQESVIRDDIEKAEDVTDEIDKKLDELEIQYPHCHQWIKSEKLQLELRRAEHRNLLAKRNTELLLEEQETKTELMEKMVCTLRSCIKLLQGHGYATPAIANQYKDIVQTLQGRKNIKWNEIPDSGISSITSSVQDDEDRQLLEKPKPETAYLQQTFCLDDAGSSRPKICSESIITSGSSTLISKLSAKKSPRFPFKTTLLKSPKLPTKSPRNKENIMKKPFASVQKSTLTIGSRPKVIKPIKPLTERPRFK